MGFLNICNIFAFPYKNSTCRRLLSSKDELFINSFNNRKNAEKALNNPRVDDRISWAINENLIMKIRKDFDELMTTKLEVSLVKLIHALKRFVCLE